MKKFQTMIILIKNSKTRVETQRAMKKKSTNAFRGKYEIK